MRVLLPPAITTPVTPEIILLHVESERDDVAVLNDVFLAFKAKNALLLGFGKGPGTYEILVRYKFRPDEAAFHIGMNRAGPFLPIQSLSQRPGSHFFRACRKE